MYGIFYLLLWHRNQGSLIICWYIATNNITKDLWKISLPIFPSSEHSILFILKFLVSKTCRSLKIYVIENKVIIINYYYFYYFFPSFIFL